MPKQNQESTSAASTAGGWTVEPEQTTHETSADSPEQAVYTTTEDAQSRVGVEQMSSTSLMLLGVFGGLYLLYTWGWVIIAKEYSQINAVTAEGSGIIGGVLQQIIFWAAPFAPLAWFLAAMSVSRLKKSGVLAAALVLGALVLLPLPMLIGGAAQ